MEQYIDIVKPRVVKAAVWGVVITVLVLMLTYFESLFKPLFIAFFIWFLIKGLRDNLAKIKFGRFKLPHHITGFLAFTIIISSIFLVFEIISINIKKIASKMPEFEVKFNALLDNLNQKYGGTDLILTIEKGINEIDLSSLAGSFANSLSSTVGTTAIVIIYTIFLMLEDNVIPHKVQKLFPKKTEKYERVSHAFRQIDTSVKKYFISKSIVSLILAISCLVIMLLFGLDYAALWAFLIFVLNFIPYVGSLIATLLPSLLATVQFGEIRYFFYVFITIEAMQIIMANVVEPKLMGKSLNLSPLTVLFSLALWGYMWGIVGMILAVPITAILVIIFAHFPESEYLAISLSEKGDILE